MNTRLLAQLALIFVVVQAVGLYSGFYLIENNYRATIVNGNPESVDNSIGLVVWILVSTAVLLAFIRFAPGWLFGFVMKAAEAFAVMGTAFIVLLPLPISFGAAVAIVVALAGLRVLLRRNLLLRNVTGMVAAAGGGALVGASLGVVPVAVFLVLLSVYDFIAVFKTGHMVTLAKEITKNNLAFTVAMPTKEHQFELGTGDLVVPLSFAVSLLGAERGLPFPYSAAPSVAVLAVSFVGLVVTLQYASDHRGKPLPALPLQAVLMLLVFGAARLAGF